MKSRNTLIYFLLLVSIILIVVLAMFNNEEVVEEEQEENLFESPQYISLYSTEKGEITNLNLNDYILCTVASEMPFKYEIEALKCQVIISRTYLFNKIINNLEPIGDACDSYKHCQAYNSMEKLMEIWKNKGFTDTEIQEGIQKIKKAIIETDGLILTYDGKIIDAVFHASSPEKTEDAKAIWTHTDIPYLQSVENIEDENYENRYSENRFTHSELEEKLDVKNIKNVNINSYTESGRIDEVVIGDKVFKATDLRAKLGLNSTNFEIENEEDNVIFKVVGFGHGVGLSQVGANYYAKQGLNYEQILKHYYTGINVENVDNIQKKRGNV